MKILVVTREFPPHTLGGISYHLRYLYEAIAERGHDVTVLAGKCLESKRPTTEESALDVEWFWFPTRQAYHLQVSLLIRRKLRSIPIHEYDVVALHTDYPFEVPIPSVWKIHDCSKVSRQYERQDMSTPVRWLDTALEPSRDAVNRRSLSMADHLIFNSDFCRTNWERFYEVGESDVILNGVDRDVFHPTEPFATEEYVLFVGDSRRKGIDDVRQFAGVSEYPVYTVGGADSDHPRVRSLGRVDQHTLAELYSGAVATIHPANFEAFGNVILESLSCGTPAVISEHCGAKELAGSPEVVVTEDLKTGIETAKQARPSRCTDVAKRHSWERVADKTIEVLRLVCS